MGRHEDSDVGRRLIATEDQLRADQQQLGSIWRRLSNTQIVIEQASAAFKESRALLDRLGNGQG